MNPQSQQPNIPPQGNPPPVPQTPTHTPNPALRPALGFVTNLLQQHLQATSPQAPQNAPGQQQTPPGTEQGGQNQEDVKTQMQGLESRLMDELQTLKQEMASQSDSKKELAELKQSIETILNTND